MVVNSLQIYSLLSGGGILLLFMRYPRAIHAVSTRYPKGEG